MTTIKSFTDLNQSKKLAEILLLESADMRYSPLGNNMHPWVWTDTFIEKDAIPCWSLTALLDLLPSGKVLIHDKESCRYKCICKNIDTYFYDNPVDACYEMILKLYELNLL